MVCATTKDARDLKSSLERRIWPREQPLAVFAANVTVVETYLFLSSGTSH